MTPKALPGTRGRPTMAALASLLIAVGCQSTRFGSQLSARPRPSPIRATESTTLRLPQDEPFSIALPRDSKAAGLDGTAQAAATAEPTGRAEATAAVTHSGTAEGLFQLGHALANDTDRQVDLEFTVRFAYEFEVHHEPDVRLPDAAVGLRLYARDDRGRLLRELALLDHSTEDGLARRQADDRVSFTLTLGPGQSVDVFLAGQARVEIDAARSAAVTLRLSELQFEVVTRPAPAVMQPQRRRGTEAQRWRNRWGIANSEWRDADCSPSEGRSGLLHNSVLASSVARASRPPTVRVRWKSRTAWSASPAATAGWGTGALCRPMA